MQMEESSAAATNDQRYAVIPLSIQKDGDLYVVGSAEMGDFYQFPEQGLNILRMLRTGDTPAAIRSLLTDDGSGPVDVDNFVDQLTDIGFIYRVGGHQAVQSRPEGVGGRTFNVDPRLARAVFSLPVLVCYLAIILYALSDAVANPALRLDPDALYIDTNRTLLLVVVLGLSLIQTVTHELGHMLAAARQGIKSRYGIGTRMWTIVAESDLTGILALPKSQRYLPMLAGLLVDILCLSLFTLLLDALLRFGANPFAVQVVQVMVLETAISIAWQFNVFIKTDIYFVICTYFSYPDLDLDARAYLRHLLHRATFARFGNVAPPRIFDKLNVLRIFSLIWALGRVLSLIVLFGVFLPTMWRYLESATSMLSGPPASVWVACDTIVYVSILLTMLAAGMYMWLKPQWQKREVR
jgi:putative peptide zinc metalloprotease protein